MTHLMSALVLGTLAQAPAPAPHPETHHQGVDRRGDHVMGFDHERTTHHFRLSRDGGAIEVDANDPSDTASRDQIRMHLGHIAQKFARGDFSAPMLIHVQVPPGVPVLRESKTAVRYEFRETPRGGRVVISSGDAKALAAIHEFLRFQIRDHRTGDPTEVSAER